MRILRGPLVYFYSVIHTLATFKPPRMKVVYDGGTFEGKVMFTVVNNLPRFGGGMRIAPDAEIDDGLLDLVIVREIPKPVLLSVFPKVYGGRHVGHPAVLMARTRRAEITLDRDMTMYGGGEPVRPVTTGEPVAVEVVPGALRVVQ
jgi:diacylglycerol kinase (ATP)